MDFNPTEEKRFTNGTDTLVVRVENSSQQFKWQLVVNGDASEPTSYYQGILTHKGFGLTTAYYDPDIREFIPFKINYCEPE